MSAFVVSNIAADLKMLTNDQRFIFGDNILPEPLASFKIDNIFEPALSMPSISNFEIRNSSLSGFRWTHTTTNTDTFGSFKLQSFINAESTGTDILLFNQDGTVTFNSPIELQNTSVGGKLYELQSNSDGSFAITDRTASALKLIINENSITANSRVQVTPTVTNTNRKVVLVDTANNDHQFIGLGANSGVFRYQISAISGSYIWYAGTSTTTSTPLMQLNGTGTLGISTAQTTPAISVNNTNTSSTVNDISFYKSTVLGSSFGFNNAINEAYVRTTGAFPIRFDTSGIERFRITANGDAVFQNTIYGRRVSGTISMQGNVTGTTISTANTFVKVAGITTGSNLNQTSMLQSNRITYTGTSGSIVALIICSFSATFNTGASNEIIFAIYKNGTQIPESRISFDLNATTAATLPVVPYNISIPTTLNSNDYIELWVAMDAAPRTVTVSRLMMTVIAI